MKAFKAVYPYGSVYETNSIASAILLESLGCAVVVNEELFSEQLKSAKERARASNAGASDQATPSTGVADRDPSAPRDGS